MAMDIAEAEFDGRSVQKAPTDPAAEGSVTDEAGEQYIAYTHALGLRLPAAQIDPVMQGHLAACRAAGTQTCIITNSWLQTPNEDWVSATLNLRATPEWIETFLGGVESEASAAGGEVSSRSTSAEDLTRAILDTDARLQAQITLRDRLQGLLETRNAELGDLLSIERELARVQGQIDSMTSTLKAMRLRVSLSEMNINYETKPKAVSASTFEPLSDAFGGFFRTFFEALAAIVLAFAVGLPWLLLIGLFLFIWLRLIWPRVRRKKPS